MHWANAIRRDAFPAPEAIPALLPSQDSPSPPAGCSEDTACAGAKPGTAAQEHLVGAREVLPQDANERSLALRSLLAKAFKMPASLSTLTIHKLK